VLFAVAELLVESYRLTDRQTDRHTDTPTRQTDRTVGSNSAKMSQTAKLTLLDNYVIL